MDRHVIKGRGPNRGMYLTYGRVVGLPTDQYGWTPKQKKAARWEEQRYALSKYPSVLAKKHNGYFVKLVAPPAIVARVEELGAFITAHADPSERQNCYWLSSDFDGEGDNFCRDCAEKIVDQKFAESPELFAELFGDDLEDAEDRYSAAIDGGSDIDHDSRPYCETCGEHLSGTLTEDGADDIIAALTSDIPPDFDDAHGWRELDDALVNVTDDDPRWRAIARVVDAAVEAERQHDAELAALAASPGMTEARSAFVGLLAARAEQKAPEPSFSLWDEMRAWRALSYEEQKAQRVREKPLIAEAKRFAEVLGWPAYWSCGCFTIKAPYGEYTWSFVVAIEQYRLWTPKAFQEGQAYVLHPCPSGDSEWPHDRDANPYPEGSEERQQWDCGFVGSRLKVTDAEIDAEEARVEGKAA